MDYTERNKQFLQRNNLNGIFRDIQENVNLFIEKDKEQQKMNKNYTWALETHITMLETNITIIKDIQKEIEDLRKELKELKTNTIKNKIKNIIKRWFKNN
jgi:uncharacterized UPF0160 family protein